MSSLHYLSVEGLPEHAVRALESLIETMRHDTQERHENRNPSIPVWAGKPVGRVSRDEIYASE
jgi:hypothetical protein